MVFEHLLQGLRMCCHALQALDEIQAGMFDGWTYEEIAEKHSEEYAARKRDKLRYRQASSCNPQHLFCTWCTDFSLMVNLKWTRVDTQATPLGYLGLSLENALRNICTTCMLVRFPDLKS